MLPEEGSTPPKSTSSGRPASLIPISPASTAYPPPRFETLASAIHGPTIRLRQILHRAAVGGGEKVRRRVQPAMMPQMIRWTIPTSRHDEPITFPVPQSKAIMRFQLRSIYFYNDGTVPTRSMANMDGYAKRLAFANLKVRSADGDEWPSARPMHRYCAGALRRAFERAFSTRSGAARKCAPA
jgi:hypothetical protein